MTIMFISWAASSVFGMDHGSSNIIVVFRYDDFSAASQTELEKELLDEMGRHGASLIVGVIPFICQDVNDLRTQKLSPLSIEKGDILRNASSKGVARIAQHGFSHQTRRLGKPGDYGVLTEFAGLAPDIQLERIDRGKALLERLTGERVTWFVPPWNSYDSNTLTVLKNLRFEVVSAAAFGPITPDAPMRFLPATCPIWGLKEAIAQAKESGDKELVVVVLFHQYDFHEAKSKSAIPSKLNLYEFRQLLDWLVAQEGVETWNTQSDQLKLADLSSERFRAFSDLRTIRQYLPSMLAKSLNFYPSRAKLNQLKRTAIIHLLVFYVVLIALSTVCSLYLGPYLRQVPDSVRKGMIYGTIILTIALIVYGVLNPDISFRRAAVTFLFIGTSLGLFLEHLLSSTRIRRCNVLVGSISRRRTG